MKTRRTTLILAALALFLLLPLSAQATIYTWTGGTSTNWRTSGNWTPTTSPGYPNTFTDQAIINLSNVTKYPVTYMMTSSTSSSIGGTGVGPVGDLNYALYIGSSAGDASGNALTLVGYPTNFINSYLNVRGDIYNAKIINLNTNGVYTGNLRAYPPDTTNTYIYNIKGPGSINMAGGGLVANSNNAWWDLQQNVSGYGTISSRIINDATLTASGGTLNFNNALSTGDPIIVNNGTLQVAAGGTFQYAGDGNTSNFDTSGAAYGGAGTGKVVMAGGTLSATGSRTYSGTDFSGYGTLTANYTNNGTMTISGGVLNVSGTGASGGQIKGDGNVAVTGSGLNLANANTLLAHNFTMGPTATLTVGTSTLHPLMELTGDFSFRQTNPATWTYGTTAGLGPDLKMAGDGTTQKLEVGGVGNSLVNNFALHSLTIGAGAYVQLVDVFSNAGTAGSETFNAGALLLGGVGDPTLDLNNISAFINGVLLTNGLYHTDNGDINVINAPVPLPPSVLLMGSGLLGLGLLGWRRRSWQG